MAASMAVLMSGLLSSGQQRCYILCDARLQLQRLRVQPFQLLIQRLELCLEVLVADILAQRDADIAGGIERPSPGLRSPGQDLDTQLLQVASAPDLAPDALDSCPPRLGFRYGDGSDDAAEIAPQFENSKRRSGPPGQMRALGRCPACPCLRFTVLLTI